MHFYELMIDFQSYITSSLFDMAKVLYSYLSYLNTSH